MLHINQEATDLGAHLVVTRYHKPPAVQKDPGVELYIHIGDYVLLCHDTWYICIYIWLWLKTLF